MSAEFQIDFKENFHYSTTAPVTITQIVESLQGLEYVVKHTKTTLQKITDCTIDDIQIYVDEIKSGSLLEDFFVRIMFGSEEEKNKFLGKIHEKIGDGKMRTTLISAIIGATIGYGIYTLIKPSDPNYVINANNNVIINIGDSSKITREDLMLIVKDSITNKKSLAQNVNKILSPARGDNASEIKISNTAIIPSSTIVKTPKDLPEVQDLHETVDYINVPVIIRAMDLDKSNKGWAGIIPGKVDQRTKIILDPSIKPNTFAGRSSFIADVTVIKKLGTKDNEYKPSEIFIRDVKN